MPAFATELEDLVRRAGRVDLAPQIRDLLVLDRCDCGDDGCAHFYTAAKPTGAYGPTHSNVLLPSTKGTVVLDLLGDRIAAVEVFDRPHIKAVLDRHLPSGAG
jgi:hypothetical protein